MPFLSQALLFLLIPAGVYTLFFLNFENGLFPLVEELTEKRILADGLTPFPSWIPHKPALPGVLLNFFWPVVTAEKLALSLVTFAFAGGSASSWLITLLEGYRGGVKGIISFTTLYGCVFQVVGLAIVAPTYLFLNLFLSKAASHPTKVNVAVSDAAIISAIPFAITVGLFGPTLITALPISSYLPLDAKVAWTLIWQLFPVWTSALVPVFKPLFPSTGPQLAASHLPALRRAYTWALIISAFSHVYPLALSLTAYAAPHLFTAAALTELHPATIFLPNLSKTTIANAADGSLRFLQWDYSLAALAHVIWAIGTTSKVKRDSSFSTGSVVIDAVLRSVLFGPMAAAMTLIWERDEAVLKGEHEKSY